MRRTLIPFVVAAGLCSTGLSAHTVLDKEVLEYTEDFVYDPWAAEYTLREAEISAEVDEGSTAPWAGEYHFGDRFGVNVTLIVAPDHGFAAFWTAGMGVYHTSFGSVTEQNARLVFNDETPDQPGIIRIFPSVLVPVRWERRLYLVGEAEMGGFFDEARSGFKTCANTCGRFLIRDNDWNLMDARPPELAARVTRVIEPDLDAVDGDFRWRKATVELDVGRNGGLSERTEFYSTTAGWITDTITVVKVNDMTAIATVSAYDMLPIPITPGTCVSTWYDDAIEKRVDGRPQYGCDGRVLADR